MVITVETLLSSLVKIKCFMHLVRIKFNNVLNFRNTMGCSQGKPVLRTEDRLLLAQTSGLTEVQVEEKFQAFLKDHPDGKLRKKDFRSMMSEALPKKDAEKLEPHVFRIYDTNSDGVIDFVEFMVVYYCLLEGSPEEVLTKLFRVFDVNSDGSISIKEMKRLVKDLYGLLKHNDPTSASEELIAKTAFKEMDVNSDGLVSQDEFVRAVLDQEQFSKLLTVNIMSIFIDATE